MARPRPPEPAAPLPRSERHTLRVPTGYPRHAAWWEQLSYLFAVGGPLGFIPWVPATWASLATAAIWFAARGNPFWPVGGSRILEATGLLLLVGGFTASTAERLMALEDPRNVVIDEIAGQTLAFLFVAPVNIKLALAGFVLFRIFDIVKLPPARQLERVRSGWGIMLDDLAAGIYAAGALWLLHLWI